MRSKRLMVDLAVVLILIVGGMLVYPRAQQRYYLWLLGSSNPEQALDAQAALTSLGPPVVPALVTLIRTDARSATRILAFEGLLKIEDDRVIPTALEVAAADWDQELQSLALNVLSRAGIREARPIFTRLVDDPDPRLRFQALRGLLTTGYPNLTPILVARLEDPDLFVAGAAAQALSQAAGQPLPFPSGDTEDARAQRTETITAWKAWYAAQIADAPATGRVPGIPMEPAPSAEAPAPPAPDFQLTALDGSTVRLRDFRGKPVLINFWSTWCAPCIREMPGLVATAQAVGSDAVVLGISAEYKNEAPAEQELEKRGDPITPEAIHTLQTQAVHAFVAEHHVSYPVLFGDTATLDAYNAYAMPTTVIVRPDGTIYRRVIGERAEDFFLAALREAAQ